MRALSSWLLARLSRVTSSGRFVPEIDGLRFIAIMSVVVFHMYDQFWASPCAAWWGGVVEVVHVGWFGVNLFFVISGFILSMPFAEQHLLDKGRVSLKKYLLRRVTRLEPPYIINLVLLLSLLVLVGGRSFAELLPHFLASLTYSHNQVYGQGSAINYVAWSLEVEVQFYILAPLLGCVYLIGGKWRRRAAIALGMGILLALYGWALKEAPPVSEGMGITLAKRMENSLASKLPYFLVGFLLTDIYLVEWRSAPRKTFKWDLIGLAAWASIPVFLLWDRIWDPAGAALPEVQKSGWKVLNTVGFASLLLAYMGAFRGRILNRFFAYPWITAIGGMCYTIYLYHQQLLEYVSPLFRPDPTVPLSPLASIGLIALLSLIVVAGASVLFVLFEKPFMYRDWPRRVWEGAKGLALRLRRRPAPAAEAVEAEDPPEEE